jgi:hypothetical protein
MQLESAAAAHGLKMSFFSFFFYWEEAKEEVLG